jgi:hypothetical protein
VTAAFITIDDGADPIMKRVIGDKVSDRSRVDFRVGNTLIECKAGKFSKTEMLKQIKRYKEDDEQVSAIIIVTPAPLRHFSLGGVPVYTVNVSNSSLMVGGLS